MNYFKSCNERARESDTYLGAIVFVTNQEKTPAAPNVMHSPLDFHNMCIIVDCLISPLLKILISKMEMDYREMNNLRVVQRVLH